jgi:hypothetical protein
MASATPGVHLRGGDVFCDTRRQLHGVAEILIAGPQHRRTGTIRLSVGADGFRGAVLPIAVQAMQLVWSQGRADLVGPVADLAVAAGVDIGAPVGVYQSSAPLGINEVLHLDPDSVARVNHSLSVGAQALKAFAPDQEPVLWPEHFDVSVSAAEVNYGVSPGDSYHPRPYAYVGPPTTHTGPFWNAPFGAVLMLNPVDDAERVVDFFEEGRCQAASNG